LEAAPLQLALQLQAQFALYKRADGLAGVEAQLQPCVLPALVGFKAERLRGLGAGGR
jgi:hypothetical protein